MKKKDNLKGHRYAFLQFDLKMKISLLFLVISVFQIQAKNSYSQNKKVTLEEDSATILQIIQKIESSTDYSFFYSKEEIDLNQKVSVFAHDELVESVLGKMFFNTEIGFKVLEEQIVLTRKTKNNTLKNKSLQQGVTIKGVVKDDGGMPVPGANVVVKGTNQGVITDFDGNYQIAVNTKNAVLVFSYVGYKDKEVIVGNQTTINVALEQDVSELDAVVMVGYGSVKKSDVTGALSSVNTEEINKTQNTNLAQAIQGRAAGVTVSKSSGAPGATPTVNIRGVGTVNGAGPLYVVDGVPINDVSTINMEDAESVEVLKDASATAIYGSRGANGVILITTKKGKKGTPVISYKTYVGVQSKIQNLKVLNATQYAKMYNEANANDGKAPMFADLSSLKNYNWKDAVYKSAIMQNHQLSVSGGTDKSTYFVSFGYINQDGIVKNTKYKRTNFRVNNTYQIKPNIKIGHNIQYAKSDRNSVPNYGNNSSNKAAFSGYLMDPVTPFYNVDGKESTPMNAPQAVNPMGLIKYQQTPQVRESFFGNLFLEAEIIRGLNFRSNFGLQVNNTSVDNFRKSYNVGPTLSQPSSTYTASRSQNQVLILSNTLNYNKTFSKKHSFNAMLGQEIQNLNSNSLNGFRNGIPASVANPTLGSGDISSARNGGNISSSKLLSFFGRVNYSYDNRYLFTGTYRFDGSTRFGSNNKWAQFPSLALAWNIHKEKFYHISAINQLKLRAGWGETGNQNIPNTVTFNTVAIGQTNNLFGKDESTSLGAAPLRPGNANLQWETTKTSNIGLDMALFHNSITFTAEYFVKQTSNMLLASPIVATAGFAQNPYSNLGNVRNKGLELTANYRKTIEDFSFNIGGNVSFIKNKVLELSGDGSLIQTGKGNTFKNISRTEAGHPLASFYGYKMEGIFQNQAEIDNNAHFTGTKPGDVKYKDLNGDGKIDDNDRTYIGSPFPKFTYGINIDMNYKQFDFSAFFQGSQGNKIFNSTDYWMIGDLASNSNTSVLDRWTGPGTSNTMPRASFASQGNNTQMSSRFVKDGSYMRLKNIQLGYALPKNVLTKTFISDVRFYVSAQNLLTFTKYDGLDPEVGIDNSSRSGGGSPLDIGIDRGRYPSVRTFSLGLNVKF
ncbi:TonB-dependent receptor [Wenyingzhuangia sp. 2_MG-2023]|uniref:TonB-dependent receptor n=1 Tax=Wenyingzhuangia sp. 2_MG-2023 TaxID=3062639 RepID=UPI0026E48E60|nr:TonB-dependent receptor [Wenyingzhuangia sp. 2_MG-2023]MDO6739112.1 TonB-dependent receptor [Wenyingzhuangia sp. 2_MG-2023]